MSYACVRRFDRPPAGGNTGDERWCRDECLAWAGCPDDCLGCAVCLPPQAAERVPMAEVFTLTGYGQVIEDEVVQPDELVVDAYGIALPDGRAVTYCQTSPGTRDPELRVWASVTEAANYWGAWVLWTGHQCGKPVIREGYR